ncbi:NAD(+) diphosphatase [Leucobacter japonicus]|uniref:NAD(+) diphosphatase n=1 Tax=Leucobacter japonicus TaxID=1461259 RepID=UPI0006A770F1|nr:NAD(+) diphosphatase [Leucobacter japonicus]
MTSDRPPLASGALDRDAATRLDPELLRSAMSDPSARLLMMRGVEIPVIDTSDSVAIAWSVPSALDVPGAAESETGTPAPESTPDVYIGRIDGAPVFARAIPAQSSGETVEAGERAPESPTGHPEAQWVHPFLVGARLSDAERETIGVASALLRWHESGRFSPREGSLTSPVQGGWARLDARGGEHFPRTDPAVIVMIEHEDRILLGSNALWETGRFSLLAGFVEAGESLEQAVAREVFEESGVQLDGITYVTSQPWPFPRSLMLGFRARLAAGADPQHLVADPAEISELRWFTRAELQHPAPDLTLPMPLSIARWMIDRWVAEGDDRTPRDIREH